MPRAGRVRSEEREAAIESSLSFVAPLQEATPTVAFPPLAPSQAHEPGTMQPSSIPCCGLTQKPTLGQAGPVEAPPNLPWSSRAGSYK